MIAVTPIQPRAGTPKGNGTGVYAKHVRSLTADRQTIKDYFKRKISASTVTKTRPEE